MVDNNYNDQRIPVFRSNTGKTYTLFGDVKRPWGGPEFGLDSNGNVEFSEFAYRTEPKSWWTGLFDFRKESNDFLSKKYRQSLPRNNDMPLIISESGQLVDPDGGLLPFQGNIGRHADNIFDPDEYIYPEGFEKGVLPNLRRIYPDGKSDIELFKLYSQEMAKEGVTADNVIAKLLKGRNAASSTTPGTSPPEPQTTTPAATEPVLN
jgi:hypothetical protein